MTRLRTVLFAALLLPTSVLAQPRTALIQTQVGDPELESLGHAVDRVLRGRAQRLDVVEFSASPALELEDIQLMVGCLNDSVECYAAFATQLEVEALLIPSVVKTGGESIVTVSFFDGSTIRQASRHANSAESESIIASLDGLLRELFGLPEIVEDEVVDDGEGDHEGDGELAPPPPPEESLSPVGPIVGGVGVAMLVAALGIGLAANNAEDDYHAAPVATMDEVDAALDLRDDAERKARAANALMGIGAAALATGVILTIVLRNTDADVRVGAAIAPGAAGLTVGGSL